MKVSVLVTLIILPMLASIGLYCAAFISKRWSRIDEQLIKQHNSDEARQRLESKANFNNKNNNNVPIQVQSQVRHAFRSHYALYGYCLDYRWFTLLVPKPLPATNYDNQLRSNSTFFCRQCNQQAQKCSETGCCMTRCDNKPDCPSYIDEQDCKHPYNQTRYYWPERNCIWQSTWIGNQAIPRYVSIHGKSPSAVHSYLKRIRYYTMFLLFLLAPLLTFLALLFIFCISCVERFYSIPFAFVSVISFASFVSGAGALGMFLYEWVQERLHRPDFAYELGHNEALLVALNPWLIHVERLGLAFWLIVAAIGSSLFTTILSCCFCCGLQSEKSKLRFRIDNDVYEIVQMPLYDE